MTEAVRCEDRYGLPISTSSPRAAEEYIEGVDLVLAQSFGPEERLSGAIAADEGFALAHAALAIVAMFRAQVKEAMEGVQRAQSLAPGTTRREQQQIEAIRLFVNGEGPRSFALTRVLLSEFPRDALMLRLAQRLFVLGCSGAGVANYPQELFALMKSVAPVYGEDWAFLGQYSFAHHEVGLLEEARLLAERSLELSPLNAVASHSVAHIFFERGDHPGGADFLGRWLTGYDRRASFNVHLSWHLALFELALGHYRQVLALDEDNIRPAVVEKSAIALADSASLLWRWQMYGRTVPPVPWEEVRDQAAPAAEKPGPAFRDAHAALAFAAAGDEAYLNRMIDGLRELADKGDALAGEVTLPLARGIGAFVQGAYDEAVEWMEPVFDQLTRIGGSHAQREVFEDTLLEAYLRAEQFDKAEDMLRKRLKLRSSPRDAFWLGRAQAENGQPEAAKTSLQEATRGWQDADAGSPELTTLNLLAGRAA